MPANQPMPPDTGSAGSSITAAGNDSNSMSMRSHSVAERQQFGLITSHSRLQYGRDRSH